MNKLKLENLQVESFETTRTANVFDGTVRAHSGGDHNDTCADVNTLCGYQCGTGTDCEPDRTRAGVTCNVTCYHNINTECGTCGPYASCDAQYGCGGTSFDDQIC